MAPIKVGIVGYGGSAKRFHLPFISAIPAYEVVAVLQRAEAPRDPSSAPQGSHCTVDWPKLKHYQTAEDFFGDEDIQFVVVATRNDTHALFAEQALLAGKHVIVDKPFATSAEEADRVIKIAKEKNRLLTCFQNRRWDGDFQTLVKLKRAGALGDIKEAEIHYDFENPPWLPFMTEKEYVPGKAMGMTWGLGTHSIDQALTLFGRPSSVTGFFRAQRPIDSEVEDSFTIILQYESRDLLVTIKTAVTTPLSQQLKFLIRGTKGSYIKYQQRSTCPQEEQIAQGKGPLDEGFGEEDQELQGILTTYGEFDGKVQKLDPKTNKYVGRYPTITGRWMGLYENVAQAINGEAELEVRAEQSRDGLRVIELARESHEKRMTVQWR